MLLRYRPDLVHFQHLIHLSATLPATFPVGAENPTLTIVALAIRQADHIAREMSAGNI